MERRLQAHLLDRAGDLKGDLVKFGCGPRFAHEFKAAMRRRFGEAPPDDDGAFINFIDWFLLQYRLPEGRYVVDRFVDAHPELPADEREMLLEWKDIVEGFFEVDAIDADALIAVNLIDDLTYRIHSNAGPHMVKQFHRGSFFMGRIVPVGDDWMLSGAQSVYKASQRREVYQAARETALDAPGLVFRNPEILERAREMQWEDHRAFIEFFGTDLLTLPVDEFVERMNAFMEFKVYEYRNKDGKTVAERYAAEGRDIGPLPQSELPKYGGRITTIGVIYDEVAGQYLWPEFGLIEEAFSNPELVRREPYRESVLHYLRDPAMPAMGLSRLADRDPAKADRLFQLLLKKPRFSWERDGEALLRRYKKQIMDHPPYPSIIPLSERLSQGT